MFNKPTILVSDIEADGLLDTVSKFHCAVVKDHLTGEKRHYRPWDFEQYVRDLEEAAANGCLLVFHNAIKYDHPALNILKKKHLGKRLNIPKQNILDTLVCTRLVYSNLKDTDPALLRSGRLNGKLFGSHSLKAWGYRLGILKGDYGEQDNAWAEFSEPMLGYCDQDVEVTDALLTKLLSDQWYFNAFLDSGHYNLCESLRLEHDAAWLMAKQERNGFPFDTKGAEELYIDVSATRANILLELHKTFGSWYRPKGGKTFFRHPVTGKDLTNYPRVVYPKAGETYTKGGKLAKTLHYKDRPFTPIKYTMFNPGSRDHIIKILKDCGWVPTDFTDAGNPVVDDDALSLVVEHKLVPEEFLPKIELIREYLTVQKLIGQLAEGDNAWLRYDKGGYIHGSVNPNGAVTGRATHAFPNMAQIPSIRKYKGVECRSLFGASHHVGADGSRWVQVGVDASGLELRCLGHFMARFDGGAYIDVILNGDIHSQNQEAAGLPTRDNAKTFIYAFLYGGGQAKLGEIVGKFGEEGKKAGKTLTDKFLAATPALQSLRDMVKETLVDSERWVGGESVVKWKRKWIKGLDGRKVHVRSPHAALNTLLQSAGAIICKLWCVEWNKGMEAAGYKHGWDGDYCFMVWCHDEAQLACRNEEVAKAAIEIAQKAMRATGEHFKFQCPLDTEGKIGPNWAVCH